MPTTLQFRQTGDRIRKGVDALREELNRQSRTGCSTLGDIDLRALYLAVDERAARVFDAAAYIVTDPSTAGSE